MEEQVSPEQFKRDAIEKVAESNSDFIEAVIIVIDDVARRRRELSAMDIWTYYHGPQPTTPRAIGAAFLRAQALGKIEPTSRYVKSGRRSDHNQLLRVWRSRIYQRQPVVGSAQEQACLF